ncbi:hypothetical protein Droror1_Dr00024048 [Drosera rotundifolia]
MFEAHVLHLLRRYLGEYVHGLSAEALRISVWKGDVVLKDLKLKAEALNSLKLPVTVKAGFIGTITLKVPWKSLGKEPVIVLIDRVFILAYPVPDGRTLKEEDRKRLFEAKLHEIEEAEAATLEAMSRSKLGNPPSGNSWLGSLVATVIGNLKITISNVHIRYEDPMSNPGRPFACGLTLAKLAAVTMDDQGNETFDTSGALDKLRKSLQLERLAVYHDSDRPPWKTQKRWEDLIPIEWVEIFEEGINEPGAEDKREPIWALDRTYLVSPINGTLKYHRLGSQERNDPDNPFEKAAVVLDDVSLTITEAQYYDWIKLFEVISRYRTHVEVSHLRPVVSISEAPHLWWRFAVQAALQQRKMCYRFSWERMQYLCQLRRRYIQLYVSSLQQSPLKDVQEMRRIERDLDSKVVLLWRLLAHAKVESVKSKEAAERRRNKSSWFSFSWGSAVDESSDVDDSVAAELTERKFTKEEWKAINNLLSYQPDGDLTLQSGKDMPNAIQYLIEVSIRQAAAKIIDLSHTEIICGRFEQLNISTKFKHRSTLCDVSLRFYGLSSPEGSLAQSVSNEQKQSALAASFVHSPLGENVDWRLSATMCPCHVTVLLESYERLREFLDRSNAVSPTIAMETATALQMKFEKVTRKAQEQFQVVLEEQSRFALHIDFDAPKVRIPIRKSSSSICEGHFLIDFGHFTLHTKDCNSDEKDQSLYSRFYISGRDISAIYSDCGCEGQKCSLSSFLVNDQSSALSVRGVDSFSPLVDKCGMAVVVDQIKVPHPSYPWMRISVQVPNLGIHVSPARYSRVVELLNFLYSTMQSTGAPLDEDDQSKLTPWSSADMDIEARVLVWKGIGNSIATWHPCFLVLSGFYLYVLDSRMARSYRRCLSMGGKQVYEVPSTNVGGSLFSIVVCSRGMDLQKALESSSTLIIEFQNQDDKSTWIKGLKEATYQASAPLDIFGYSTPAVSEFSEGRVSNLKAADLVINGTLMETKLFIYGKSGDDGREKNEETLLVEVFGAGGKVHLVLGEGNLAVNVKLHSLKIKDELQGHLAAEPQYLAYSVVKNEQFIASPTALGAHVKDVSSISMEEEDIFNDALPEFLPGPDSIIHSENFCPLELDSSVGSYADKDPGKGRLLSSEIFYETVGSDSSDFVSLNFVTKDPSSPDYDGIDTQMNVYMSKMEFFCNRPTLVALIGFGLDVSSANYVASAISATMISDDILAPMKEKIVDGGNAYVKGLLGFGKGRVVFKLSMIVDSVTVTLNKEDGAQLAIFVQESFILDLKVHPCSISIEGKLGNLRLQDVSLGNDHCWSWLCDIRNPGVESLIKFTFKSYSAEDDDYAGYDYSLCGRLSGVRIVFLYRFVREISAYFMELATPHTEEVIKLVDKVGDFEWFIQKYEIDGSSSIKLDLSLDTPIIIIPKSSTSKDYMQLDLGQLQVRNEFVWHGGPKNDPSAVHLDVLRAEILGINMAVGIDGCLGKPMIREGDGFVVSVRRSLRDVFRKVPTFSLEVQIDLLHGVMLDKEYDVILNCAYANMNEEPRLPPSFRAGKSGSADTMKLLVDKVNINSQNFLSRTVTIVAVEVNHALLELCTDVHEISALAHISLEGLWVSYRMTSLSEVDLYVTVPKFCIMDARPDSKPEMRLMLGSSSDISRQGAGYSQLSFNSTSLKRTNFVTSSGVDNSTSTMLLLDYRWRATSQSSVVRIQLPRILVVPDFLLAVGEFFVPALGAITGRDEMMDPDNDPIRKNSSIALSVPVYKQQEEVVWLSPSQQLIADHPGVDDYTYDGCGKTILLKEENNPKESNSSGMQPIIVIGRGKRLRFVNVKIENGSLLTKYTYLSNDSSYSASPEDGVDIVFFQMLHSDDQVENQEFIRDSLSMANSSSEADPSKMQSFTFEAQVISPELTFYDGTKSSQLDSSQGEKLLRAKFDLSFMYASKEDDTWVRSLVKDLTIEAGSGLVILDPVDISGGYTSVKDKTNMSLTSTDIHFHLSLSVISLLLNLQNQASAALQFGNTNPLAPCTNYERVWVSPKEHGPRYNLTFWRPRPPSNYVILGDCVTSRPIPPSQAIMAVSNTYGRVRKPVSYRHIGFLSAIRGVEGDEETRDTDAECSLWLPVAPTGYVTLGCVVNVGNHPPSTHVAYCIRADLVTSTMYSECIYSVTSTMSKTSGFSIWRLDNVLGSFIAHSYADCPPKDICYDLNHCLVWNTHLYRPSVKRSKATTSLYTDSKTQEASNQTLSSSGWDIIRSYSKANNCFISTPNFERIWWDKGGDLRRPISLWRPIPRPGYAVLGDCIAEGLEPPALGILFLTDNPEISAKPVQFTKVAQIIVKGVDEAFFWYPIAPPGYVSIGCIVTRADEPPSLDVFCCPRMDLVNPANIVDAPISRSSSSRPSQSWSLWKVENQACTFLARSDMKNPSSRLAYTIGDFVKPKARENVTAELKLRCLSLTVVDSLCGIVTPLFDLTVTNIKLATHGRLEAINAVLVSSMAASTFNGQLGAWEPLVEPFDGIFKFETYETCAYPNPGLGKRVRVAATSILNINVSAANLDSFIEAIVSWRRQRELEEKASKLNEGKDVTHEDDPSFSALDEVDFQTITIENKLGCDIYVKRLEESSDEVDLINHNGFCSVWIPPPRSLDRLIIRENFKEARYYIAVNIFEAKEISIIEDGNSQNFFCAARLVVDNQPVDQQKLFPQSARTKCVKPWITKMEDTYSGTAKWNELFIFEVPRKGQAKLELEVTNLGAKAGKGEVVGAASFPVRHGANTLRKISSARMLHQQHDLQNVASYPLRRREQVDSEEAIRKYGSLVLSTSYFERKAAADMKKESVIDDDTDSGLFIALSSGGPWEKTRSLLPLSVVPKTLGGSLFAMEVVMKDGKKHAIFRGLATVVNDSDIKIDVIVCPASTIDVRTGVTLQGTNIIENVVTLYPGASAALPWRSMQKDSEQFLQVRPSVDHPSKPYSWGSIASGASVYASGKDQFVDQGLLSRQSTIKQGNKLPPSVFKLSQLEKKDVLLHCSPSIQSSQFWLSAGTDASVLHTELNDPVYDWKISISSPLKLENRLPCPADFTIWEKARDGKAVERQQGVILSRKSAEIYAADIQKPLYISLFLQGGWCMEKDPLLILDPYSTDLAASFWMVHRHSRRRLRVSIERDMGGTSAAPKIIRFFVPYWITNDSSVSLSYRVVEIEPLDGADIDSLMFSRAAKSPKLSSNTPVSSLSTRQAIPRKNVQVLDVIEDSGPIPSMLSPQDYVGRGGVSLFTSRNDSYLSPKVGIAVAIRNAENYSPGFSLLELEKKGRVDVKAFNSDGSYFKLSAQLNMTSDRTKVVHLQPHTLYISRVGRSLCLQQCGTDSVEWFHPMDPPRNISWQSSSKVEMLKIRMDGYGWSTPFSVGAEGTMLTVLKHDSGSNQMEIRVAVRSGTKSSRYEVVFRPNYFSSPYRIENRSLFLPIRFRQADGPSNSWRSLPPNAAASYLWEDVGRQHLLELSVDGTDQQSPMRYNIDEIFDHQPVPGGGGPARAIRVTVLKEEKMNIVKISDWIPSEEGLAVVRRRVPSSVAPLPQIDFQFQQSTSISNAEFHVIVELSELGISITDHTPEEILYLSVQNLMLSHSSGLGADISRFKLRMHGIQVDNQLPLTPMPVLFRPQNLREDFDYIVKFSMTSQSNGSLDLCVYPYIGFHVPENSSFLINIHEPIIWRLHEVIHQVNFSRLYDSKTTAVAIDPIIEIRVLNISEVRLKVSMAMSPTQRPKGVLGFWSSLMTALGNMENMPVRLHHRFVENVSMRQSAVISNATSNVQKDLLSQSLRLLYGVDILGNASSALGHMSKGVAALSMDKKFIQSRQRQESKGVEDFGDVIREGGGALAKGFFRGVTGILTKPLEGAKASGVEGFVQGVGKGIIGAAAQPVSGVLDLLSKTTEGANAMRMKILAALTSEEQLLRRRLPRAISGDNLLRPYDEYKAQGQVILQLAESGSFLGQVDLFKVRGKFALSDAYENHFMLPKGRILVVTHRRVILLQQPSIVLSQKKFTPAKDPCSVFWDVIWDDLVTMELTNGKKDQPNAPPSRVIIYLRTGPTEQRELVRVVKCIRESHQAIEVYTAIQQALDTYGPSQSKGTSKKRATRPYSPLTDQTNAEGMSREGVGAWSSPQVPPIPLRSTFGSS